MPVPFLLLYALVLLTAGLSGLLAGGIGVAIALAYTIYGGMAGFGPAMLDIGSVQLGAGLAVFVAAAALLLRCE